MKDATTAFFEDLSQRGHDSRLDRATGTVRFDIVNGKRVDRWLVAVNKGDVAVSRGNRAADTVFRTDRAVFEQLVQGKTNPVVQMLLGTATLEGKPELLVPFRHLFTGKSAADPRSTAGYARRQK